jgi:hypothetical protein
MKWVKHMKDVTWHMADGAEVTAKHAEVIEALLNQDAWRGSMKIVSRALAMYEKVRKSSPGRWLGMDDEDHERFLKAADALMIARPNNVGVAALAPQFRYFDAFNQAVSQDGPPESHED